MVHFVRPHASLSTDAAGSSRLVVALQVVTVVACLALGVAFFGSLAPQPVPPDTTASCPVGSATPC
jgi:hypothetical protein